MHLSRHAIVPARWDLQPDRRAGEGRGRRNWCASALALAAITSAACFAQPGAELWPLSPDASWSSEPIPDEPVPAGEPTLEERRTAACPDPTRPRLDWLERTHRMVYHGVCGAGVWLDHFFADGEMTEDKTYGRLGVGMSWDQRDGIDPDLQMRARIPLQAFKQKLRLLVGRGNDREIVENRNDWSGRPIPEAFREVDDSNWLMGLGYGKDTNLEQGWEFDAGIHVRSNPDAVVKTVYRRDDPFGDDTLTRFRETLFWRASRGLGTTTQINLDHLLNERFMVRWANAGTVAEDTEGMDWYSSVTLYQNLPQQRGLGYTALVRGETAAPVALQDYGVEITFRTRLLRDWLFLELSSSLTWPRYLESEERTANFGAGVGVEMYFGPVPVRDLR